MSATAPEPAHESPVARALAERVKELRAMHRIAEVLQKSDRAPSERLRMIAEEVAAAMQVPADVGARVSVGAVVATSEGWRATPWCEVERRATREGVACGVEVAWRDGPPSAERAMPEEERALLRWVADTLAVDEERREAKRRLEDNEALLEMASRLGRFGAWYADTGTGKVRWTGHARAIHGLPADAEPDLPSLIALYAPEDRARMLDMPSAFDAELQLVTPTGERKWVRAIGEQVKDDRGSVVGVQGAVLDITERKETELALRRAGAKLAEQAAMLDRAREAIMVRDLEDRIIYWNSGCERVYGWTADEVLGRVASELLLVEPSVAATAMRTVLERGEWADEVDKSGKDGRVRTIEARWSLLRDDDGTPRAVFSIDGDVSARKRLEQELIRAQRLESLGTLAGGIAHDLNNVLAPILMAAIVLEESERDPERRADLAAIRASAERGAELVKQLVSFARGQGAAKERIDLGEVVAPVERLVRTTFPRNITQRFIIAKERWPVRADATQVHQVLVNLCVNARDAMPHGGGLTVSVAGHVVDEIEASMHPDARPGRYMTIEVDDTGLGMTPEVQARIFEPFFTTKPTGQGTGFGLSTVHTIVRAHGGFIEVFSEPGRGARFRVHLPADVSAARVATADDAVPASTFGGRGELVLVIDDEESIRFVTQRTLERFGYRVIVASNGAEAAGLFARHKDEVAVVLTDMAMPVMDGPATIVALRAMRPGVRVIGSSGLGADGLVAKSIDAGARWFVDKPYTAEALLRVLEEALSSDQSASR